MRLIIGSCEGGVRAIWDIIMKPTEANISSFPPSHSSVYLNFRLVDGGFFSSPCCETNSKSKWPIILPNYHQRELTPKGI